MKGRRTQKRFIRRCEVAFVVDGETYRGISSDFSLNGLFIRTNFSMIPNTVLDVTIYLPDGSVSKVKVRVVRSWRNALGRVMGSPLGGRKNGMGVEIIEKDANYLHLIRELLL